MYHPSPDVQYYTAVMFEQSDVCPALSTAAATKNRGKTFGQCECLGYILFGMNIC